MLIVKRLAVWGAEIISQAALLGLVLISLFGYDRHAFGRSLLVNAIWILVMFLTTGYVVTTAISRTIWKGSKLWLYSIIATVLFLIHFEVLNIGTTGAFAPSDRAHIRVAGACIAFVTTLAGTTGLRRWTALRAGSPGTEIFDRSPR